MFIGCLLVNCWLLIGCLLVVYCVLDVSKYPKTHDLYCANNEGVLGKFKDECNGKPIDELIGLRSKMYSIRLGCGEQKKAAAGVKKVLQKKN